jgi:peptide/nickel transport system permease protein
MAVASVVILTVLTSAVVLGPFVWRVPINEIDFTARLSAPGWQHPFGTDDLGQDLLARMLYGGRISLAVGLRLWPSPLSPVPSSARYQAFPGAASTPR